MKLTFFGIKNEFQNFLEQNIPSAKIPDHIESKNGYMKNISILITIVNGIINLQENVKPFVFNQMKDSNNPIHT